MVVVMVVFSDELEFLFRVMKLFRLEDVGVVND